jgi:hypothetical protein
MPTECRNFKIIRFFGREDRRPRVIKSGLTEGEARQHCRNPETSSRTATSHKAKAYTRANGEWFDGYSDH